MSASTAAAEARSNLTKELDTLKTPEAKDIAPLPKIGFTAPSSHKMPLIDGRPTLIVFLRHCGCPFAEKIFKKLTQLSNQHEEVHCIAVSHSSKEATDAWIPQVGGDWAVDVVVDPERDLYAQWGLGLSNTWHIASPWVLYSVFRLGQDEGIWNRTAESGTRWQKGGAFALDRAGTVKWLHVSKTADDLPDLEEALKAIGVNPDE